MTDILKIQMMKMKTQIQKDQRFLKIYLVTLTVGLGIKNAHKKNVFHGVIK